MWLNAEIGSSAGDLTGNKNESSQEKIVSKETQEKIKKQLENTNTEISDVFFNIEYSGLDLAGNRYILKSKEARNS